MNKIGVGRLLAFVGCLALLMGASQHIQSQKRLGVLLQNRGDAMPPSYDPQQLDARNKRAWKLYQVWRERTTRDVATEIAPYLQDEDRLIREDAARALSRLKNKTAERILMQVQQQQNAKQKGAPNKQEVVGGDRNSADGQIASPTLKLALGRIQSRDLKGRAKVEAIANSVGLSFAEVARLSATVNEWGKQSVMAGTEGNEIVQELVDVLYQMGKDGEDIASLTKQMTLNPTQVVKLQGATLPVEQELKLIIDHVLSQKKVGITEEEFGATYLPSLGQPATEAIIASLDAVKQRRAEFERAGLVTLMRAAALTNDSRALSLLKEFGNNPDPKVSYYAIQAREAMENQSWYPPLP